MKESIYGYHDNRKIPFLRITMALPKLIAPAKRILETGFKFAGFPERGYSTYESNIDYEVNKDVQLHFSRLWLQLKGCVQEARK